MPIFNNDFAICGIYQQLSLSNLQEISRQVYQLFKLKPISNTQLTCSASYVLLIWVTKQSHLMSLLIVRDFSLHPTAV